MINLYKNIQQEISKINQGRYLSKKSLYTTIDYIRTQLGIDLDDHPDKYKFYSDELAKVVNIELVQFDSKRLCGLIVKNELPKQSTVIINSSKSSDSQKFALMHELVHFFAHPIPKKPFLCDESNKSDPLEWQANEGSAEILVPYRIFIPRIADLIRKCSDYMDYVSVSYILADEFATSVPIITNRMNSLVYEINQYIEGIPLDRIKILSKSKREKLNLKVKSLNVYIPKIFTCVNCTYESSSKIKYCSMCGCDKFNEKISNKGVKNMIYDGVKLDENSKAIICPRCGNEEPNEGNHCSICGAYLVNRCTNVDYPGRSSYDGDTCGALLDGNARYCTYCGSESTFFRDGLLEPWEKVKADNVSEFLSIENPGKYDAEDLPF